MTSPLAPQLAIVCGSGEFPLAVAEAVGAAGRPVFLIGIKGAATREIERFPHGWIGMGRLRRLLTLATDAGAKDIVFVGAVPRPSFGLDFIPDLRFLRLMLRLLGSGDNRMLTHLAAEFARYGLTVKGVHEVAPGLMLPAGPLTLAPPAEAAIRAAQLGMDVLNALGPYDIGQGAVVADQRVVALEAAEGTDLMLARVAELRRSGRLKVPASRCVFVKAPKRGQDLRLDTPAVGIETVKRVREAGLGGIAVAARQVMTPNLGSMIAAADQAGLFLLGMEPSS